MTKRLVAALALALAPVALVLLGCASAQLVAPDVGATAANRETLVHGRKLFVAKCGGCHPLHAPSSLSDAEWLQVLDEKEMAAKAKLKPADREAVLAYVTAVNGRE